MEDENIIYLTTESQSSMANGRVSVAVTRNGNGLK